MKRVFDSVIIYCRGKDFSGYDPFDALNSPILSGASISGTKWGRIAAIQIIKRSPINFRPLFRIKRQKNPKGIGLFLSALSISSGSEDYHLSSECRRLVKYLLSVSSISRQSGHCWGYNFDWQSRTFFLPSHTPTVVATTFIAEAFIRLYKRSDEEEYLTIARSACDFIMKDLNRFYENDNFCFSYSPLDKSRVFNASILGARLLVQVGAITGEKVLFDSAQPCYEFLLNNQNEDGGWVYGCDTNQQWVDSFHTGYILESLLIGYQHGKMDNLKEAIDKVIEFYDTNFFLKDGTPKYYIEKVYPIDIHSAAQAIIIYTRLDRVEDALRVFNWVLNNLWNEKGYFYFQKHKMYKNKIEYMRWSQSWMAYAMSLLLAHKDSNWE